MSTPADYYNTDEVLKEVEAQLDKKNLKALHAIADAIQNESHITSQDGNPVQKPSSIARERSTEASPPHAKDYLAKLISNTDLEERCFVMELYLEMQQRNPELAKKKAPDVIDGRGRLLKNYAELCKGVSLRKPNYPEHFLAVLEAHIRKEIAARVDLYNALDRDLAVIGKFEYDISLPARYGLIKTYKVDAKNGEITLNMPDLDLKVAESVKQAIRPIILNADVIPPPSDIEMKQEGKDLTITISSQNIMALARDAESIMTLRAAPDASIPDAKPMPYADKNHIEAVLNALKTRAKSTNQAHAVVAIESLLTNVRKTYIE